MGSQSVTWESLSLRRMAWKAASSMVSFVICDVIAAKETATPWLDLVPDRPSKQLAQSLSQPRGKRTVATHLKRHAGIAGRNKERSSPRVVPKEALADPVWLAAAIKSLPLTLVAPRPLEEAISTAGGVSFEALDDRLMFRSFPGVFCAGRNAGLGGTDRRISAHGLCGDRTYLTAAQPPSGPTNIACIVCEKYGSPSIRREEPILPE